MNKRKVTRRDFLRLTTVSTAGLVAACVAPAQAPQQPAPAAPEAAAPAPAAAAEAVTMMGFPRSETVFAQQLTGRNATPSNFNFWAGWRRMWRGRGRTGRISSSSSMSARCCGGWTRRWRRSGRAKRLNDRTRAPRDRGGRAGRGIVQATGPAVYPDRGWTG